MPNPSTGRNQEEKMVLGIPYANCQPRSPGRPSGVTPKESKREAIKKKKKTPDDKTSKDKSQKRWAILGRN